MKTLKTLLPAFALLVAFSTSALAQTDVNVSAEVVNALTVNSTAVDFGTVDNNIDTYLNSGGGEATTTTTNVSGSTPGTVNISNASENAALTVSWDATVTLEDGANSLTFTPALFFGGSGAQLADNTGSNISLGAGNTSGTINIGGDLNTAGAPAGNYTATTPLSVTVDYQ